MRSVPAPRVIVNLSDNDPTRGDARGMAMIGQKLAQELQTHCDIFTSDNLLPKKQRYQSYNDLIWQDMVDNGMPSVFLDAREGNIDLTDRFNRHVKAVQRPMVINKINEVLALDYLPANNILVPHHITPDNLRAEGKKFIAHYGAKTAPLYAFLVGSFISSEDLFAHMRPIIDENRHASFFILGSTRSSLFIHESAVEKAERYIAAQGKNTSMRLMHSHIDTLRAGKHSSEHDYNPYIGLLDQADYVFLEGDSLSMLSETIAAGKPVHIYNMPLQLLYFDNRFDALVEKGMAVKMNDDEPLSLSTARFPAVNVTDRLVNRIARHYKYGKLRNPFSWG